MIPVEVDTLRPREAVAATELMRRSFAPKMIEHGTLRCSGYPTYLADQLSTPLPRTLDAWAVRDGQDLRGVLVANRGPSSSHLAYVAVGRQARGRGIARALTDTWIAANIARACTTLTLDVVASNEPARRLYSEAGFAHVATRCTTITPLARLARSADEPWWSDDLTGFLGTFQRYGFGRLRLLNARDQGLTVGLLDSGFIRHPLSSELRSAAHVLHRLLPEGRVLSAELEGDTTNPDAIMRLERRLSPPHTAMG